MEASIDGQTELCDIVMDADCEGEPGGICRKVVEHRAYHGRGEFLGGKAEAATAHQQHFFERTRGQTACQGADDILVQGFAVGAGLLGAVQYCNPVDRFR